VGRVGHSSPEGRLQVDVPEVQQAVRQEQGALPEASLPAPRQLL